MNRILPERPILTSDVYAPVMPRWVTICLQLIFIGFAITIVMMTDFFSNRVWAEFPFFFKGLMFVLLPTFIFGAFHPKGWKSLSTDPFFVACSEGIYFPFISHGGLVKSVDPKSWLFVSWKNMSNIRTEKLDIGGEGKSLCAVFDIKATNDELRDFFLSHKWADKVTGNNSIVFYGNAFPSPKKVAAELQEMMDKNKKNSLMRKNEGSSA
ncbi:MAG TPA: hypothetical protein PKL58_08200 [Methylophilaceae bacterium]|nr:hypothetical protein [Methylophilaceae bacterium]